MCTFVVKHANGVPTRAKSQIVILGNLDLSGMEQIRMFPPSHLDTNDPSLLTALAVQSGGTLKQGNCKFAFIQATFPDEGLTRVKPSISCPFSPDGTYWRL